MKETKLCAICRRQLQMGEEIKISDGFLCKCCASGLSPWFSSWKSARAEDIRRQLAYRQRNRKQLEQFRLSRYFGDQRKVLVDDESGTFLVACSRDLKRENPDIIPLEAVRSCTWQVKKSRNRQTDAQGSAHYFSSYLFRICLELEHPFIDRMEFYLSEEPLVLEEGGFWLWSTGNAKVDAAYCRMEKLCDKICHVLTDTEEEDPAEDSFMVGSTTICPWCGAETRISDDNCCEHCGRPLEDR